MWLASGYGMDFTDEGYYLVWIDNPAAYKESATQFGFFYHPIYEYFGKNIGRLRQANILVTFGLSWCLGFALFRVLFPPLPNDVQQPLGNWRHAAFACVTATSYPNVFDMWLPTPSYNSLAMQAALLVTTGFLLTGRTMSGVTAFGAVLIGVGGWMAFLAKPTTAAAFALLTLLYWLLSGRFVWKSALLSLTVAFGMLLLTAVAIDGSLYAFVQRLTRALDTARLMGVQPSMGQLLRIDRFELNTADSAAFVLAVGAMVSCVLIASLRTLRWRWIPYGFLLLVSLVGLAMAARVCCSTPHYANFRGMLMLAVPVAAAISATAMVYARWTTGIFWSRPALAVVVTFAMAPHAYAFGTGNNYWQSASAMSIFWLHAGLATLIPTVSRATVWLSVLPVALGAQMISLLVTNMALAHPYRQPSPITTTMQEVAGGPGPGGLHLDAGYARYVDAIRAAAGGAGFRSGTPVIDLTGHSPGSIYVLGAHAVGVPWLLGGYPGSDQSATRILSSVACSEMAAAWLLVEPNGPRHLSPTVLERSGIEVQANYRVTGKFVTPVGFGGYATPSEQQLLKPVRPLEEATRACLAARGGGS